MSDEIKQAIEALRPFAEMANGWDDFEPDSTFMADYDYGDEDSCFITLGQCRRAREAATALETAPAPSPDQIRREALKDAKAAVLSAGYYCVPDFDQGFVLDQQIDYCADAIEALDTAPTPSEALKEDPFFELVVDGIAEADKAMRKFPQPTYVISKIAEEAGEVVKAAIHHAEGRETAENVKAEMRQLIAMLFRLYIEGDQIHGMAPLITGGDDD